MRSDDMNQHKQKTGQTVKIFFRVDPRRIVDLKSLLEGYEGLLVLRTRDPDAGIIELIISPDFHMDVQGILKNLSTSIWMESVQDPFPSDTVSGDTNKTSCVL